MTYCKSIYPAYIRAPLTPQFVDGVHVIHQLAQAGRTLVAVILNCKTPDFAHLIAPATEGLRSCVGLLRRFSGRYLCGLRSADIIEEFCRSESIENSQHFLIVTVLLLVCHIPVDTLRGNRHEARLSPAWLRPVQKRRSPSPAVHPQRNSLPKSRVSFLNQSITNGSPPSASQNSGVSRHAGPDNSATNNGNNTNRANPSQGNVIDSNDFQDLSKWLTDALDNPASANALLSTQEFFDLSAAASPNGVSPLNNHRASISSALGTDPSQLRSIQSTTPGMVSSLADSMLYADMAPVNQFSIQRDAVGTQSTNNSGQASSQLKEDYVPMDTLGPASAAFDQFESLEPDATLLDSISQGNGVLNDSNQWDVPFASGNDVLGQM